MTEAPCADTRFCREKFGKIGFVLKADLICYLLYGKIGLKQEPLALGQPPVQDILLRAYVKGLLEQIGKIHGAYVHQRRKLGERDAPFEIAVDVTEHGLEPCQRVMVGVGLGKEIGKQQIHRSLHLEEGVLRVPRIVVNYRVEKIFAYLICFDGISVREESVKPEHG